METTRITFVGTGDAFGSGGRLQTCIVVDGPAIRFAIDFGASSLIGLRRVGLEPNDIDLILLTHLHGDRFGSPYSRVWGCHLSGMWVYRLGLAKAKYYALTGEWISGREAARIELINFSCPLEALDDRVAGLAGRLARIPLSQLAAMKLIVNQAYDNMGLQSTQILGPVLDSIMRNTPEGRDFIRQAAADGVHAAVTARDAPFGDYSQGPPEDQPRRRSTLP